MEPWLQSLISVVIAVMASSGFWTLVIKKSESKDVRTQILLGLAHDRIMTLGQTYIDRGYITMDEYDDLNKYLYTPYKKLGGNGTAERMMTEIDRLPLCSLGNQIKKGENHGA